MTSASLISMYLTAGIVGCVSLFWAVRGRHEKFLGRVAMFYGPLLVGLVYLTWTAGRLTIGHWPRPNLDDPSIMAGIDPFYFAAASCMLLLPLAVMLPVVRLVVAISARDQSWIRRAWEGLVAYVLLVGSLGFLRLDADRVLKWFMD
jgi:hypothetical protein